MMSNIVLNKPGSVFGFFLDQCQNTVNVNRLDTRCVALINPTVRTCLFDYIWQMCLTLPELLLSLWSLQEANKSFARISSLGSPNKYEWLGKKKKLTPTKINKLPPAASAGRSGWVNNFTSNEEPVKVNLSHSSMESMVLQKIQRFLV